MSRSDRIYRLLLRLYSKPLRRECGEDMAEAFHDMVVDARRGGARLPTLRVWLRVAADLTLTVPGDLWRSLELRKRRALVRLPARSPNLNAHAERFVLSVKSECLDKLVLLGERHLRDAVREYTAHYHEERNHQGLDGRLIRPPAPERPSAPIECRERLGSLLRYYHRKAA